MMEPTIGTGKDTTLSGVTVEILQRWGEALDFGGAHGKQAATTPRIIGASVLDGTPSDAGTDSDRGIVLQTSPSSNDDAAAEQVVVAAM